MKQFTLSVSMGKRLIGKGMAAHPRIQSVLQQGTLVIIAGTTNGYVAEEILAKTGQHEGFSRMGFRRGIVVPPKFSDIPDTKLEGDVVLVDGVWLKGKTIFDVADDLKAGDVILKGGNMVDVKAGRSAVYIGHPKAGTIGAALQAVAGRRVQLIVPIGLEKRVLDDVNELADLCNADDAEGPRILPMPGKVFTELDAVNVMTGAKATLLSGGGIYGAEGCVWIGVTGTSKQLETAELLIESIADEPPCRV